VDKDLLQNYTLFYFQNEQPVPLKLNQGIINIYPILVKDWVLFESSLNILQLDKNNTNDPKQIQMSYLDFLLHLIEQDEVNKTHYKSMLANVLLMSLHESNIGFIRENDKPYIIIVDDNKTVTAKISSKEFNKIKDIILYYNIVNYNDIDVSEDIRKLAEEYYKLKNSDSYTPTLQEQKTYLIARTGLKLQDINEMAYRTFQLVFKSTLDSEMFLANKIIQASFKYDIKQDVSHPLFTSRKNPYEEIFANKEEFINKINQANGG
jgi:hypothetical protein